MTSGAQHTPNTPETLFYHAVGEHILLAYNVWPKTYISLAWICPAGANSVSKSTQVTAVFLGGDALVLLARLEKDLVIPMQGDCVWAILTSERSGPRTVPTGWSSDMKVLSFTCSGELQDARKTDGYSSCACLNNIFDLITCLVWTAFFRSQY